MKKDKIDPTKNAQNRIGTGFDELFEDDNIKPSDDIKNDINNNISIDSNTETKTETDNNIDGNTGTSSNSEIKPNIDKTTNTKTTTKKKTKISIKSNEKKEKVDKKKGYHTYLPESFFPILDELKKVTDYNKNELAKKAYELLFEFYGVEIVEE